MDTRPRDVPAWRAYWAAVPRRRLFDRARAANTPEYVEMLLADGLDAIEIEQVFVAMAARFCREQLRPPPGSYTDLLLFVPGGATPYP